MTDELRKRYFGDRTIAQRHIGDAELLLDAVKDQVRLGGLEQFQLHRTLGNGVQLFAASRFGQDEVRIFAPPSGGIAEGLPPREYCVWEADSELFTDGVVIGTTFAWGPHTWAQGPVVLGVLDPYDGSNHGTVFAYTQAKLETTTPPVSTLSGFNMAVDVEAKAIFSSPSGLPPYQRGEWYGWYLSQVSGVGAGLFYTFVGTTRSGGGVSQTSLGGGLFEPVFGGSSDGNILAIGSGSGGGSGVPPALTRIHPGGGVTRIDLPSVLSGNAQRRWDAVSQIDGTIWVALGNGQNGIWTDTYIDNLYRQNSSGSWDEIVVEDGFGPITWPTQTSKTPFGEGAQSWFPGLMHDPITDAVAVVKGDLSGAWIFNGRDCFGKGLGTFYRKFETVPMDMPLWSSGNLFPTQEEIFNRAIPSQFYDGVIYVKYSFLHEEAPIHLRHVVAAYKIGKLKQVKATSPV